MLDHAILARGIASDENQSPVVFLERVYDDLHTSLSSPERWRELFVFDQFPDVRIGHADQDGILRCLFFVGDHDEWKPQTRRFQPDSSPEIDNPYRRGVRPEIDGRFHRVGYEVLVRISK